VGQSNLLRNCYKNHCLQLHHTVSQYLFERLHIFIWSIGNGLFRRGNWLLFGVRLYVARCTRNDRRYRLSLVWWVEIYVAGKSDKLALRLSDMRRIRMQWMTVRCLHIQCYLLAGIQTRRQINSIKCLIPENFEFTNFSTEAKQFDNLQFVWLQYIQCTESLLSVLINNISSSHNVLPVLI